MSSRGRARSARGFDPVHDELFRARRGDGAWCDTATGAARLHVADTTALPGAFVALGHHDIARPMRITSKSAAA